MSFFSKILQSTSRNISKAIHKEQRGIYNVTYNGKNATTIYKDLEKIDEVIAYTKGNRNKGARHIHLEHSLDSSQQRFVTPDEVANLGKNIRAYINKHGDPHIDKNGARLYEWKDEKGNSFRAVVNDMPKKEASGYNSHLPAASEEIITFYSDRNLAKGKVFEFKNPKLQKSTHPLTPSTAGGGIKTPSIFKKLESTPKESSKQDSSTLIDKKTRPMERE